VHLRAFKTIKVRLTEPHGIPGGRLLQVAEVRDAIARLKADLVARGEAHDLFGREREDGLAALLGISTRPSWASRPIRASSLKRPTCCTS
jgi:hypothetical protein